MTSQNAWAWIHYTFCWLSTNVRITVMLRNWWSNVKTIAWYVTKFGNETQDTSSNICYA